MIVSPNVRPLNKLETRRFPPVEDITITANAEIRLVVEVQQEAVAGWGPLRTLRGVFTTLQATDMCAETDAA